jgi:hypothetical protein
MKSSLRCCCGAQAEYSVCVLVLSLGVRPRRQRYSRAQTFCAACIQRLLDEVPRTASCIQESLTSAYTAIADTLGTESHPQPASECGIDRQREVSTNEPEVVRCDQR